MSSSRPGGPRKASVQVETDAPDSELDAPGPSTLDVSLASADSEDHDPGALLPVTIPDRRYFRIGEVAAMLSVKPHVLRYWESEFRQLRPQKSRQGQRLYRRREVELLVVIRRLLHGERYTIAGAREKLREISRGEADAPLCIAPPTERLQRIIDEIEELKRLVDRRARDLNERW